ncbi:MAG TPA: CBS domain-containing protein [Polyangiaceae bacterium]|jgi:CBS domain-containing protein
MMKVRDLMTTNVASLQSREPLSAAAQRMWECDCGAIPVTEDGSSRVIGMITDRDICMATWTKNRAPSAIELAEVISRELYFCAPEDGLSTAGNLMRQKQVRRIPVLDENRNLVGILSLADIASYSQPLEPRTFGSEIAPSDLAATLANICHPRAPLSSTA